MEELKLIAERLSRVDDPRALLEGLFLHAPVAFQIYEADGHCVLVNPAFRELFGSEPPPEYNVLTDEIVEKQGFLSLIHRAFAGETIHIPTPGTTPATCGRST
jgi:PAS domain-containing protein